MHEGQLELTGPKWPGTEPYLNAEPGIMGWLTEPGYDEYRIDTVTGRAVRTTNYGHSNNPAEAQVPEKTLKHIRKIMPKYGWD